MQEVIETPVVQAEPVKQSNFLAILLSSLLFISVVIAGFFAYQTQKLVKELTLLKVLPTPTAVSESVVPSELTFEQDKTLDPTANWKTYTNIKNGYTFKYPTDWTLEDTGYGAIFMSNSKKSVGIVISDSQYPYGYGPGIDPKEDELSVTFLGKIVMVKEIDNSFVDFSVTTPKELHILFGTGYPVASVGDNNKSLSDYSSSKEIIFKILSTFKFVN